MDLGTIKEGLPFWGDIQSTLASIICIFILLKACILVHAKEKKEKKDVWVVWGRISFGHVVEILRKKSWMGLVLSCPSVHLSI
jgi:hypothetical protein